MSRYDWIPDWTSLPRDPLGWMHSGIAVVDGRIVVGHPGEPTLLFYDADGALRRITRLEELVEPHTTGLRPRSRRFMKRATSEWRMATG